jgi:small-conductance mechanosensitive channel
MPPANQNREAEDLLKQTDMLKEQVTSQDEEVKKMRAKLEYFERKAAEEAEVYKKSQEPRYEEYIAGLEASTGEKLTEAERKQYYSAFTNPA